MLIYNKLCHVNPGKTVEIAGCEFFVASILLASAQREGYSIIGAGARRKMRGTPNQSVEQVCADFSVFSPECV
jgi:hypothetical protein